MRRLVNLYLRLRIRLNLFGMRHYRWPGDTMPPVTIHRGMADPND